MVFAKGLFTKDLLDYRAHHMVTGNLKMVREFMSLFQYFWVLFDVVAAFVLGALATVLVEYPGLALQKKLLPQMGGHNKKA